VQLVLILLMAVSVLTFLSGVSVLLGARRGERAPAFLFFLATLFALGWAAPLGGFLALTPDTPISTASILVYIYYTSAPLMCWALMSYTCHRYKIGRVGMVIFGLFGIGLVSYMLLNPGTLYYDIELSAINGNKVYLTTGAFSIIYGVYHFLMVLLYGVGLIATINRTKNDNLKKAHMMVLVGFGITGVISLIFNFILPATGEYKYVWVGPLTMSFAWVFHYYAVLRYRLLDLAGTWLKVLSYIIIMTLTAIVYVTIFFIIFFALFKISSPSIMVIMLNILMITLVILLFPVLSEISNYVRSLVDVHNVDLVYIVKKMSVVSKEYINFQELADFLSQHLHYQYVGLLIDGKLYNSKHVKLTATDVKDLDKRKAPVKDIWVEFSKEDYSRYKSLGVEGMAELRDGKGSTVGKILLGRPLGGVNFNSREITEVETALTIVAAAISTEKGSANAR